MTVPSSPSPKHLGPKGGQGLGDDRDCAGDHIWDPGEPARMVLEEAEGTDLTWEQMAGEDTIRGIVDTPGLSVVATPIGNLGDFSPRAKATLEAADVIACEDTRRTGFLCHQFGIGTGRMVVHDHNEGVMAGQVVERIQRGEHIALVSDAGTPGISDPGHGVINAVIEAGLPVQVVPGPVAAITALVLSGFATDRFTFEGFLPRKAGARQRRLEELAQEPRTMIFYVSPHRAGQDLEALSQRFGADRRACLARELTKKFEEAIRLPLGELVDRYGQSAPKGEIVLVVEGYRHESPDPLEPAAITTMVQTLMGQGHRRKAAAKIVAEQVGLPAGAVYDLSLGSSRIQDSGIS